MLEKLSISMSLGEIIVYIVLLLTYYVAAWEWAKNGIFEVLIQSPPNRKIWLATILGFIVFIVAKYLEKRGYLELSLFKEENLFKTAVAIFGSVCLFYFLARFFLLPEGIPEYNRAEIRTFYYANKYFQAGIKKPEDDILGEYNGVKKSLRLFEEVIEIWQRGPITILYYNEGLTFPERVILYCPNCSSSVIFFSNSTSKRDHCSSCNAELRFKNTGRSIRLTASGPNVNCLVNSSGKNMVALAYARMALLLRITNQLNEAGEAITKAQIKISEAISNEPTNKSFFETQSLIFFLIGELAHVQGNKEKALSFYKRSLEIDLRLEIDTNIDLVEELIEDVS